jgi:hypothetical protein
MTSQGSAYGRLRKALDRRLPTQALIAAAELDHVGLADALELVLLLRDDPRRYDKAIVRWTARYASEYDVPLAEAQAVLALLAAARDERSAPAAMHALADLLHRRRGLERAAETLNRTASETAWGDCRDRGR